MPSKKATPAEEITQCTALLKTARPEEKPGIYLRLGDAYAAEGKMAKAVIYYRQAIESGLTGPGDMARVVQALVKSGDVKDIDAVLEVAWNNARTDLDRAGVLVARGYRKASLSRFLESLKESEEAHQILFGLDGPEPVLSRLKAEASMILGIALWETGETARANRMMEESLDLFTKIGDSRGIAKACNNLCKAYGNEGHIEKSLQYIKRGLEATKDPAGKGAEGHLLTNLGYTYRIMGDLKAAEKTQKESIRLSKAQAARKTCAFAQAEIALISIQLGELKKAMGWVNLALERISGLGDTAAEARVLNIKAKALQMAGDLKEAEALARKCLEMAEGLGAEELIAMSNRVYGSIIFQLGNVSAGERALTMSVDIYRKLRDRVELAESLVELAIVLKAKGDIRGACIAAKEVRDFYKHGGGPFLLKQLDEHGL